MSGLIVPFNGLVPKIDKSAFIAPNATLIGNVEIGANCGIWFGAVLSWTGWWSAAGSPVSSPGWGAFWSGLPPWSFR